MKKKWILTIALLLACLSALAIVNRSAIRAGIEVLTGADFAGPGHGSVTLVIAEGETGSEVAKQLVSAGVVKSFSVIYRQLISTGQTFYPGTYRLKLEMSSEQALHALADPDSRVSNRFTIREGLRYGQVLSLTAEATGLSIEELKAAAKDLSALGIPVTEVSAEGWLFPATYSLDPGISASEALRTMVDRTKQELRKFSVSESDWHYVLTLASVIQKEGRIHEDFYKISAVFLNRIAMGMYLQSDATVSYGVGGSTVSTSNADRANPNRYNTYLYPGLPVGPIGAPGSLALDAALHPAEGKWLYFCTINLATGETVFSNTYQEHQVAVRKWLAWMKENPGYD